MNSGWLIWSSLFSLIGFAVFVYGRKQSLVVPTLIGLVLMVYPYFVSSVLALIGIGGLLIGGLFFGSRLEDGA
jgi:hypothetical protein